MNRNLKNTRNPDVSLGSGTKLLLPSWLLGFQHEERERHNFYYADCSSSVSSQLTDPTNAHAPRSKQLDSLRSKSQLTAFFKIAKNPSPSLPGMRSFTSPVYFLSGVFIVTSVIVTSSPCEREHMRSMCASTRALSRKVLSLTKPKDKI